MKTAWTTVAILGLMASTAAAQSALARRAAREVVKALEGRLAREAAEEGLERVERNLARAIERWGDDVARAARRVGPRVAVAEAERGGAAAARILARWGDDGARLLAVERDAALRVHAALGDEGVEFLIRRNGTAGAALLTELAPAMARSGRGSELLAVLEQYGDRAALFVWRHKGVIAGGAVLAAFLADPKPYLDGVRDLVVAPARDVAVDAARRTNWTVVALVVIGLAATVVALRRRRTEATRVA